MSRSPLHVTTVKAWRSSKRVSTLAQRTQRWVLRTCFRGLTASLSGRRSRTQRFRVNRVAVRPGLGGEGRQCLTLQFPNTSPRHRTVVMAQSTPVAAHGNPK